MLLNRSLSWRMREQRCFDLKKKKAAPGSRQKSHHSRPSLHTPRSTLSLQGGKERKFASNNVDIQSVGQRNPLKLLQLCSLLCSWEIMFYLHKEPVHQRLCSMITCVRKQKTRPIWTMGVFTWLPLYAGNHVHLPRVCIFAYLANLRPHLVIQVLQPLCIK